MAPIAPSRSRPRSRAASKTPALDPSVLRLRKAARLVYADDLAASKRPAFARAALPGTPAKVDAMRDRVDLGQAPCHPNDLTVDDCAALGLTCAHEPANGAASWSDTAARRRAASTAVHAVADERAVHEDQDEEDAAVAAADLTAWEAGWLARVRAALARQTLAAAGAR